MKQLKKDLQAVTREHKKLAQRYYSGSILSTRSIYNILRGHLP